MELAEDGGREVNVFDPIATAAASLGACVRACASVDELLERSAVVVITTPWKEFAALPLDVATATGRRTVVIDCWGLLRDDACTDEIEIVRLGRPLEAGIALRT